MADDEYEIMSRGSLSKIKKDVDEIKKKTSGIDSKDLVGSINELKASMENMINIFKVASDGMKSEEHDQQVIQKQLGPINDKLNSLIEQNEELAKGLVVVADMVKEHLPKIEDELSHFGGPKPPKATPPPSFGAPPQGPPAFPPPGGPSMNPPPTTGPKGDFDIPPLDDFPSEPAPPEDLGALPKPKKKGLMGMFKK